MNWSGEILPITVIDSLLELIWPSEAVQYGRSPRR